MELKNIHRLRVTSDFLFDFTTHVSIKSSTSEDTIFFAFRFADQNLMHRFFALKGSSNAFMWLPPYQI
jgi:hypothetical protein